MKMERQPTFMADWNKARHRFDGPKVLEGSPLKTFKLLAVAALVVLGSATARPANRDIYPDPSQAKNDVAAALKTAAQTHKRVLLDFGGNWCGDCQVLDIYFHNSENLPILESNFVLVHVNIGHMDINLDIAGQYQVPLDRGVPALAVLSEKGKLLYSQKSGEFEAMRRMEPSTVTTFLVQWKPAKEGCSAVMVNC
jgi:thiol:disulfide interchange protein